MLDYTTTHRRSDSALRLETLRNLFHRPPNAAVISPRAGIARQMSRQFNAI